MAKRWLSMRKIREVLRLCHAAGMSVRAIARSVKASPSTVGKYIRRAEVHGLGWPLPGSLDDGELEHRLFPAPAVGDRPDGATHVRLIGATHGCCSVVLDRVIISWSYLRWQRLMFGAAG